MKTLLFLLIPTILLGQQQAKVKITNINPIVFCSGDSIEIAFTYTAPPQKDTTLQTVLLLYRGTFTVQGVNLWEGNYNYFHKLKKLGTVDTNYLVKVRVPVDYGPGSATVTPLASQNFYKTVTFNNCTNTTGITDYQPNTGAIYYRLFDPTHTPATPIPGEVYLKQVGTEYRKVRFD